MNAANKAPRSDGARIEEGHDQPQSAPQPDNDPRLPETIYYNSGQSGEADPSLQSTSTLTSASAAPTTIFHLTRLQRIIAGSGHILNDLCASLWFTYLLLYMQKVVKFNDAYSAGLLFWGQVRHLNLAKFNATRSYLN